MAGTILSHNAGACTLCAGVTLSAKFALGSDASFVARQLAGRQQSIGPGDLRNYQLRDQWPVIIGGFLQTLILQEKGERVTAVKEFKESVLKPVIEMLSSAKDESTNWLVPVIMGLVASAKLLSEEADEELLKRGQSATQVWLCVHWFGMSWHHAQAHIACQ